MTYVAGAMAIAGSILLVVAAVGLFVLPDALARQHAATKAATVALGAVLLAVALVGQEFAWWWRALLTIALLFATLPVSSQMLARAAAKESGALDVPKRADTLGRGTATTHASDES